MLSQASYFNLRQRLFLSFGIFLSFGVLLSFGILLPFGNGLFLWRGFFAEDDFFRIDNKGASPALYVLLSRVYNICY